MAEWLGTRLIICSTLVQTQLNASCFIRNRTNILHIMIRGVFEFRLKLRIM